MKTRERSILMAVTSSVSCVFFEGQLRHLQQAGWRVAISASPDLPGQLTSFAEAEGVEAVEIPMRREISPGEDLGSLFQAVSALRQLRPMVSNVGTPKAGLIVGLAAVVTRVPYRVYTVHGLRFEGSTGGRRLLLTLAERLAMSCAHQVVCVSSGVALGIRSAGLAPARKTVVLGAGSVNGVLVPDRPTRAAAPVSGVIGYVGRLARDKGVDDLVDAFTRISAQQPTVELLVCGDVDPGDPPSAASMQTIARHPRITHLGHVSPIAPHLRRMSLLALPSYREGLPAVLLEAAAQGLPVVATTATGSRDAFVDGRTGLAVTPGDVDGLVQALTELLTDEDRARRMGTAGRAFVRERFSRERVWRQWTDFYGSLPTRPRPTDRVKRVVDVVLGGAALVVSSPLVLASAVVVWRTLGRPVLFHQERPGRHGQPFHIHKFRTMSEARGIDGTLLPDASRVSRSGAWLRRTSLDELPSLWNVVRGDMSLVGPRPLLGRYLPHYTQREALRHAVRPGLTGWAQIHGRNTTGWAERLEQDAWYVENRSLTLDAWILLRTINVVIRGSGVVVDQRSTMPDFDEERRAG